ncbi:lipoate--protein ligase family protein [Vibrio rhodolitus]|uniref:lipoate--protein ligase family protein n=1 Tax=Vibrio rhodolitus TaxID=2231649 RepID=UPI000E0B9A4D|nr:lipoate--protein ligase [Vibrio rhodolitus]
MANKNKIIRYAAIDAHALFEKEHQLIEQVKEERLDQVLLLWQAKTPTLVLPSGKKWPESDRLNDALANQGWQLTARKTGGAPVPQLPGIINLSHIYSLPEEKPYDIKAAYLQLCNVLIEFFKALGMQVEVHATPNSYCDGDYNLNIGGQKIVGTAQRVLLKKGGGRVVLSQACIIIDADVSKLVEPVITCNQICQHPAQIEAKVHTSLFDHIQQKPSVDTLFQMLTDAFLRFSPR